MISRLAAAILGLALVLTALPASTAAPDPRAQGAANAYPLFIIAGPDGNLWFTAASGVGRITTAGVITLFSLPGGTGSIAIAAGADGNLWFTEDRAVGRITPAGHLSRFLIPATRGQPAYITSGPGRSFWLSTTKRTQHDGNVSDTDSIGLLAPSGRLTWLTPSSPIYPSQLLAGPDGNLWFTEPAGVGRITRTGKVTRFPLARHCRPQCEATSIAVGPDGNLWFTILERAIGRITPGGHLSLFHLPPARTGAPVFITPGPDGNLWFSEIWGNRIGRATLSGQVREFSVPGRALDYFDGIARGPDGNLWFTIGCRNAIGRSTPSGKMRIFHIPGTAKDAGTGCVELP